MSTSEINSNKSRSPTSSGFMAATPSASTAAAGAPEPEWPQIIPRTKLDGAFKRRGKVA